MFSLVDQLSNLNETHSLTILSQAHSKIRVLVNSLRWKSSIKVKKEIIRFLKQALQDCKEIMINGCRGIGPTPSPGPVGKESTLWYRNVESILIDSYDAENMTSPAS